MRLFKWGTLIFVFLSCSYSLAANEIVINSIIPSSTPHRVEIGQHFLFSVSVTTALPPPIKFVILKDGTKWTEFTATTPSSDFTYSSNINITSAGVDTAGIWKARITAGSKSVTTPDIVLNVGVPPSFGAFPLDPIAMSVDGALALKVSPPMNSDYTYQWLKNGSNISGATSTQLWLPSLGLNDSGVYYIKVTNRPSSYYPEKGSLVYGPLQVSIQDSGTFVPLTLVTRPSSSVNARVDKPISFGVNFTGDGPLQYEWYLNNKLIPSAKSWELIIDRPQLENSGTYKFIVRSPNNVLTVDGIKLNVGNPSVFTSYPPPTMKVALGQPVSLSATATNLDPTKTVSTSWWKYSWASGEARWSNTQMSSTGEITIPSFSSGDSITFNNSYFYAKAKISKPSLEMNGYPVRLYAKYPNDPIITPKTKRLAYTEGENILLEIDVTSHDPLKSPITFEWSKDSQPIAGSVGNTLLIGSATVADRGVYSVTARNLWGTDSIEFSVDVLPKPIKNLIPKDVALVINDNDPYSIEIGEYYRVTRQIPFENIIHVTTPVTNSIDRTTFDNLKTQIDSRISPQAQIIVLAWTYPAVVECNSITSAISRGLDSSACSYTCGPGSLPDSPYYGSSSNAPFTDIGFRPSMMLAARSVASAKAMINRGVSADGTNPHSSAYLMYTTDDLRSLRTKVFNLQVPWPIGHADSEMVNTQVINGDSLVGKSDVMFYFTGLTYVPNLRLTQFLPGAVADSLTSFSGSFVTTTQMSMLDFIESGATGSFGTVTEPCAQTNKFSDPRTMIKHYGNGDTLIEAYWKSLKTTFQGQFIGEPLAAPFRRDPDFSKVVFLSHLNGNDGFSEIVSGKFMTTYGDVNLSTESIHFGGASAKFDGDKDYVTLPDSPNLHLGSEDWTIELWWNPTSAVQRSTTVLAAQGVPGNASASAWWLELRATNGKDLVFYAATGDKYTTVRVTDHNLSVGEWHHIAVVRKGNKMNIFIDGINRSGRTISVPLNDSSTSISIGDVAGKYGANGFIDNVRITKGVARYTNDFSIPFGPFPNR